MLPVMLDQTAFILESRTARFTHMWSLSSVCHNMESELLFSGKPFVTCVTAIGVRRVDTHMLTQILQCNSSNISHISVKYLF